MCAPSSPARHCARVIQLPAPTRPIERGMPAPGLLAQVIVAKYADHCPLYRQAGHLPALRAWIWIAPPWPTGSVASARLLEPLVEALGRYVLAAEQGARRRHPGAGTRSGPRPDQDRAIVDLRAR